LLALDSLSKSFQFPDGREHVLFRDVSLTVENGVFASLIGPNGCGKSTLFRIIAGYVPLDSGSVSLNGKALQKLSHYERAKYIGYVDQDTYRSMASELTCGQVLALAQKRRRRLGLRITNAGDAVRRLAVHSEYIAGWAEENLDRQTKILSGGQRQLLSICAAVLGDSELLLLDEHSASLDEAHKRYVDEFLFSYTKGNKAVALCITHDHEWVKLHSDVVYEFQNEMIIMQER
jgi:putative ABC transport system ATP-binding protein